MESLTIDVTKNSSLSPQLEMDALTVDTLTMESNELAQIKTKETSEQLDQEFEKTCDYVLTKNQRLYQRLA